MAELWLNVLGYRTQLHLSECSRVAFSPVLVLSIAETMVTIPLEKQRHPKGMEM